MKPPFIPPRTRAELATPAAPGGRHEQARRIIFSLVAQKFYGDAIFAQVRAMYGPDLKDPEIWSLIRGAEKKSPAPAGYGRNYNSPTPRPAQPVTMESATATVERFLKGFRCEEADLWDASPWSPLEDPALDAIPLLAGLFQGHDLVNLCPENRVGITKHRDEWLAHVRKHGAPSGNDGCLFRPNPVSGTPTGEKGGWTDADVTAHRFALVESDLLSLDLQLSVLVRLPFFPG